MSASEDLLNNILKQISNQKVKLDRDESQIEYISVKNTTQLIKQYFADDKLYEEWILKLAVKVSSEGEIIKFQNDHHHLLTFLDETLYMPITSLQSLMQHPSTELRAFGKTTPCAIKTPNNAMFNLKGMW